MFFFFSIGSLTISSIHSSLAEICVLMSIKVVTVRLDPLIPGCWPWHQQLAEQSRGPDRAPLAVLPQFHPVPSYQEWHVSLPTPN